LSVRSFSDLEDVVVLVQRRVDLYIRWSKGPESDRDGTSFDSLTGVPLPGLSASPLLIESWWGDRSAELWTARRLYDYRHLREVRGPGVRPWLLIGREVARGPDNEPLVICEQPVGWLEESVISAATKLIDAEGAQWGPLQRERDDVSH
jgi:hypothetical protein